MRKILLPSICILLLFLLSSCSTVSSAWNNIVSKFSSDKYARTQDLTLASQPYNVFMTICPPMSTPEKAVAFAFEDVARHIAMMNQLYVFTGRVEETAGRSVVVATDYSYSYDDSMLSDIISKLELVKNVSGEDNQNFVTIKYSDLPSTDRCNFLGLTVTTPVKKNEKPSWVTTPPHVDGYYTGVGVVLPRRYVSDTFFEADMAAAQSIVQQVKTTLQSYTKADEFTSTNRSSYVAKGGTMELSEGYLSDFYIVDRWIDADGNGYSLAVSKR